MFTKIDKEMVTRILFRMMIDKSQHLILIKKVLSNKDYNLHGRKILEYVKYS